MADGVHAGNIMANRNRVGASVASQRFGGEGLSGTGPKAGGPHYLARFTDTPVGRVAADWGTSMDPATLAAALQAADAAPVVRQSQVLPGPTGELNKLTTLPRPPLICAGPGSEAAAAQHAGVVALGGRAVCLDGALQPGALRHLPPFGGLIWWGDAATAQAYAEALSTLEGPIIPLICGHPDTAHACFERHLCVDTTAAGGNAGLLAGEDVARAKVA